MMFRTIVSAAALLGVAAFSATPSTAGDSRYRDRVHADTFGNLVIYSAAGYKRIIVGQGHLAEEVRSYTGGDEPDVVYHDDRSGRHSMSRCPDAVLLKGRSYMYGLPDGVVPQPACH